MQTYTGYRFIFTDIDISLLHSDFDYTSGIEAFTNILISYNWTEKRSITVISDFKTLQSVVNTKQTCISRF